MSLNCLVVERATTFLMSSWESAQKELPNKVIPEKSPRNMREPPHLPLIKKG